MPVSQNLSLEEETPVEAESVSAPELPSAAEMIAGLFQRVEALEAQVASHVEPDAHNALYGGLESRLSGLEQALARIAGGALQLQLGPNELAAIGGALKGHIEQAVHDVLKTHYGLTPPAQR